jgi:hypothetical protein
MIGVPGAAHHFVLHRIRDTRSIYTNPNSANAFW